MHTERTFAIARSSADTFERVIFEMSEDGVTGRRSGAHKLLRPGRTGGGDGSRERRGLGPLDIEGSPRAHGAMPPSALTALDNAMHDLAARRLGVPVYRLLGLARPVPVSAYTRHSRQGDDRRPRAEAEQAPDTEGKGRRVERHRDAQGREGVIGGRTLVDANEAFSPKRP